MLPPLRVWARQSTAMFAASAVLGPLCDGCHSRHDVLHYAEQPGKILLPALTGAHSAPLLETCWWVPVLFGVAGVLLGGSHPYFDVVLSQERFGQERRPAPGWLSTMAVVACFCASYELSGSLAQADALRSDGHANHLLTVDALLFACAAAIFAAFERTAGGAFMAVLTAVAGPAVEIGLVNVFHLYSYSAPDLLGVPSWIPWVYAAGAPAVGALGRQCLSVLEEQDQAEKRVGEGGG